MFFYVPPYYTSKADPATGFVNLIHPKYESVKKSKEFFKKFDKIYFDAKESFFVFEYTDGKVNSYRKNESEASWAVCTHGDSRYVWNKKERKSFSINVNQEMKKLFNKYKIDFKKGEKNLLSEILKIDEKRFFEKLIYLLKTVLQLRHGNPVAKEEKERDFILSPVSDAAGRFFDSRKARAEEPQNADANGAFHIALKGLATLNSLKESDLKIKPLKNKEWFEFIRKRHDRMDLKRNG